MLERGDRSEFEDTILRAVHWFADSTYQLETSNRFLSLMTCIEALMNPSDKMDITHRIATNVATIVSSNLLQQGVAKHIRDVMISLYATRSKIVHGSEHRIHDDEVNELEQIARFLLRTIIPVAGRFKNSKGLENALSDHHVSGAFRWPDSSGQES
jgi:Apea-like HEPN